MVSVCEFKYGELTVSLADGVGVEVGIAKDGVACEAEVDVAEYVVVVVVDVEVAVDIGGMFVCVIVNERSPPPGGGDLLTPPIGS